MSGIEITGLDKSFGRNRVLDGLDLVVPDGVLAAVLGSSGCGKTTLLRIIAGFEPADGGVVSIGGEIVDDGRRFVRPEARRVGYIPQEGALFPHLSVAQNVGFGLPRRAADREQTIAGALELVGLSGLEKRRPNELSGGQQQRVALARALAPKPRLLLLDEPFAALDPATRTTMRAEIATLLRSIGATAILVTHDQGEALSLADFVAVVDGGHVVQADSPWALYTLPKSGQVARFLGEANLLPSRIDGDVAHSALGTLQLLGGAEPVPPNGSESIVLVRPEQLVLRKSGHPPRPAVTARVISSTFFGHDTMVSLRVDGPPSLVLEARTSGWVPAAGELVGVSVEGRVVAIAHDPDPDARQTS